MIDGSLLQILKNQVGAVAPDAAALISRGDSLIYAAHAHDPLLADYMQTHCQVTLVLSHTRRHARDTFTSALRLMFLCRVLSELAPDPTVP